jgi:hypothetical protein
MDKSSVKVVALALTACLIGCGIGYIDSRPGWDDTGITAGALLLSGVIFGSAMPKRAWLTGLALGVPVFMMNVALHGNYGSALAIGIALVGAGIGALSGWLILGNKPAR